MSTVAFTTADGLSTFLESNEIDALIPLPGVTALTQAVSSDGRITVVQGTAVALPTPARDGFSGGGLNALINPGAVASFAEIADASLPTATCRLTLQSGYILAVEGALAAVAAALSGVAGGGGGGGTDFVFLGTAIVNGADGVPIAATEAPAGQLFLRAAYVPGSGSYELETLAGNVPATSYLQCWVQSAGSGGRMTNVVSSSPPLAQRWHIGAEFFDAAGLGIDTTFQITMWRVTP